MEPRALASTNTTPYTTPHKEMSDTTEIEKASRALAELSLNKGTGPQDCSHLKTI
jgi:hypothetical protein